MQACHFKPLSHAITPQILPISATRYVAQQATLRVAGGKTYVEQRNPGQPEYLQAASEVIDSLWPFIGREPKGLSTLAIVPGNSMIRMRHVIGNAPQPRTKKMADITSPMPTMPERKTDAGSRRAMRAPKYPPAVAASIITSACDHATRPPAA